MATDQLTLFWITKAALPHLPAGSSIINTSSGRSTELAPAYVFLASPESSCVTGETLNVNGGMPTS